MNTIAAENIPVQLATFRIEEEWFGIDVLRVQEVMTPLPVGGVPLAKDHIVGLINVRGVIVTSISLKSLLGFEKTDYAEDYHNIIFNDGEDGTLCLMVDEIGDVAETANLHYDDRPSTVPAKASQFISGIFRAEKFLITFLDLDAIASAE